MTNYLSQLKLGTWWHCLDSNWIIKSDLSSVQIRDCLKTDIDPKDSLIVLKLSGEAAWTGFADNCSEWLKNNLQFYLIISHNIYNSIVDILFSINPTKYLDLHYKSNGITPNFLKFTRLLLTDDIIWYSGV